jgi:hypothetical protein
MTIDTGRVVFLFSSLLSGEHTTLPRIDMELNVCYSFVLGVVAFSIFSVGTHALQALLCT